MEPGDPFANFSFEPSRSQGRFRAFTRPRSKYKYMSANTSKDKLARTGSSTSLASITGSTQNLVDPLKVMSMQDEARSKRISTEVMKNRLYESVVTSPRKRRFSMRMDFSSAAAASEAPDPQAYARMVQSLPVTPAHSQNVSPAHSPTSSRRFLFGFFSRGATPHCVTPEEMDEEDQNALMECEEDSWKGLASLFKPQPRYIPGARYPPQEDEAMDCEQTQHRPTDGLMGPPPPPGIMFRSLSRTNNTPTSHGERPS